MLFGVHVALPMKRLRITYFCWCCKNVSILQLQALWSKFDTNHFINSYSSFYTPKEREDYQEHTKEKRGVGAPYTLYLKLVIEYCIATSNDLVNSQRGASIV